jgi:dCMP deaminase
MDLRRQKHFMKQAQLNADLSYAEKLKVGAVAVRDGHAICDGYNGTPPGEDNVCEEFVPDDDFCRDEGCPQYGTTHVCGRLKTKPDVEHAERNLIYFAARKGIRLEGASLFITHSPCVPCARAILNVGFEACYYAHVHKEGEGRDWLASRSFNICQVV